MRAKLFQILTLLGLCVLIQACATSTPAPVQPRPASGIWSAEETQVVQVVVDALLLERFGSDWQPAADFIVYFDSGAYWRTIFEDLVDLANFTVPGKSGFESEPGPAQIKEFHDYAKEFLNRVESQGEAFQSAFANLLAQEQLNEDHMLPPDWQSNWTLFSEEMLKEYFQRDNAIGQEHFLYDHPNAYGPYSLQRPAISNDGALALVRMQFNGVDDHYGDNFYILDNVDGRWQLRAEQFEGLAQTMCIRYAGPGPR